MFADSAVSVYIGLFFSVASAFCVVTGGILLCFIPFLYMPSHVGISRGNTGSGCGGLLPQVYRFACTGPLVDR